MTTLQSPPLGARGFPILLGSFYPSSSATSSSPSSVNGGANGSQSPPTAALSSSTPTSALPITSRMASATIATTALKTGSAMVPSSSAMWPVGAAPVACDRTPTSKSGPIPQQPASSPVSSVSPGLYQSTTTAAVAKSLSPPVQSRHHHASQHPLSASSPAQTPTVASTTSPLMKVNIVPKRSPGGGHPYAASSHFHVAGSSPHHLQQPFSTSADSDPLVVPKRRQPGQAQQRAYIEANEREMPSSSPSIVVAGMPKELAELEHLLAREGQLLEQLKLQFKTGHHPASLSPQLSANPHNQELINELPHLTSEQQSKRVAQELRTILESKKIVLSSLMPSLVESNESPASKEQCVKPLSGLPPQVTMDRLMAITSQPAEIAVANRYLMPGPVIVVATSQLPKSETGTLIVSVRLLYHASCKEVTTTLHGKQDILQGIKQVTVDKLGRAIFNKLKVMEVSSKHRHQSFCLEFSLDEYSAQGLKRTITTAKSTPFHVQSRPAKRKREAGEEEGTQNGKEAEATEMGSPTGTMCGQKKVSNKDKKLKRSNDGSVDGGAEEAPKDTTSSEGNYIDITDLLTLPQKEAAKKLGISESMLCKRFKECTRRKWPYRYLRKIDKIINMLNLHKADGEGMSEEDRDKLTRLHKEREECLRPVKIRITSYDRLSPVMRHRKTSDCDEEDIPIDALQTLEMLRIFKPQGDAGELSECGSAERDGNSSSEDDEDELEDDLDDDGIIGRKKNKGGDEGEEEEQTDELRMDADGDEDESECSMHLAHDEPQQQQQPDGPPFPGDLPSSTDDGAFITSHDEEDEMETVASGKLPR